MALWQYFFAIALSFISTVSAEPIEQVITLRPGWNAVFLEVDPNPADCSAVFSDIANLERVWAWTPQVSTVEYIQDPETLVPDQPAWRVYMPDNPIVTNLFAVSGGKPYLIKIGGSAEVSLTITGEPCLPSIKWQPDSFNYVGFHLDPGNEPFFEEFFAPSPAHSQQEIYYLSDTGIWKLASHPDSTRMPQGEAFWIYTKGHSQYQGPLAVQLDQREGAHYGQILNEQSVKISNLSASDIGVSLSLQAEQQPIPLYHWHFDPDVENPGWQAFPLDLALAAEQDKILRLGVRRSGLSPGVDTLSNIVINNNRGSRIVIPASVTGIAYTGLWVGAAVIQKVSEPRIDTETPVLAGSQLSFRLILHVDDTGEVRLLKQAIQLWDKENSQYVLVTDDSLVDSYSDKNSSRLPAVRRISSAAFSRLSETDPKWEKPMTGSFAEANGNLVCAVTIASDEELNPFLHKYHPAHTADKSYEVSRNIEMLFSQEDSDGNPINTGAILTWGGSDMGGIYRETLEGLHREKIMVEGIFLLHKVSSIGQITR